MSQDSLEDAVKSLDDDQISVEMDLKRSDEELEEIPENNATAADPATANQQDKYDDALSDRYLSPTSADEKCSNIVRVTNVSPMADIEQMRTLFGFLGEITEIELYQFEQGAETSFKVCFVEFANPQSVLMAQHLTNTVFIDRPLIVAPYNSFKIPDKKTAQADSASVKSRTRSDAQNSDSHKSHEAGSDLVDNKYRSRHRDRDRSDRHYGHRRSSPRDSRSHRSSKSRDRDLSRRRSRSRERSSRRSRSPEKSSRRRSRSKESRRRRSRSKESSRSSRHHKSSRR